jgi:hypothetical protein
VNKVNLFIVGAPKCGTTAWAEYLSAHPDIEFCSSKEPHFFCDDFQNFRWAKTDQQYADLFSDLSATSSYIGEASPMYLFSKNAARNIYDYNPEARILILLREPSRFLQSYHRQLLNIFEEDVADIERAWSLQEDRSKGKSIPETCREQRFLQYREVASFSSQVARFLSLFGNSQVKILIYEDWVQDPAREYAHVIDFLGLPSTGFSEFEVVNKAHQPRSKKLARFTHRPPSFALKAASLIRRLTRLNRLGIAARLKSLNRVPADQNKDAKTEVFIRSIADMWEDDIAQLEDLTGIKLAAWRSQE